MTKVRELLDIPERVEKGQFQVTLREGVARLQCDASSLVSVGVSPHAPYTVSDAGFAKVVTLAEQIELPILIAH